MMYVMTDSFDIPDSDIILVSHITEQKISNALNTTVIPVSVILI